MSHFKVAHATTALLCLLPAVAWSADWPQWRGPARSGISAEKGLIKKWPGGGPRLVWKAASLGEGHSSVSVAKGRIYGMGLRGRDEVVWALDEKTGKPLWSRRIAGYTSLGGRQGGYGPRCTPTVDSNRVYVLGVGGDLACLDARSGVIAWQRNVAREYQAEVPQWGYSESPLVDGNRVIVAPGGRRASVVAFNKANGAPLWASQTGDTAHYASAIAADVGGKRQYVHFLSRGVIGLSPADGKLLWRYDSPANPVANCSTPLYRNGLVFAASGYNNGGGLARISANRATEVYRTRAMQNHHGGMVLVGDYVYGYNGNTLESLELKTGKVKWTANRGSSVGKGCLVYADGQLIARSEGGRGGPSVIGLIAATPTGYVEKGRFEQPEPSGQPTWAYPVIANGRLYIRDMNNLFCYELRQGAARR